MRLINFINDYYRPKAMAGLAETTKAGYNSTINKYIIPTFGHYEMEDITVEEIENWLKTFSREGAAEKAYKTLRQIIRKAQSYDKFNGVDPTTKYIKVPKKKGYQPKLLTAEEVSILLQGFKGHYLEPTVICAVMLGLRRGEAFGLTWEDIDLTNGRVRINKTYQNVNGTPQYLPTKTVKSTRNCWLPAKILDRMKVLGEGKTGRISIVTSPDKMAKDYKDYCLEHNLPFVSFTNLRHTWATLALESGSDIAIVANMLGHTEITTAYNHYLRPRESTYQKTQEGIESIVPLGKIFKADKRSVQWKSWTNKIKKLQWKM